MKDMNILLTCSAGMSTSMLVECMSQYCRKEHKKYNIWTVDQGILENELEVKEVDVVLLGPQVRHILKRVKKICEGTIPVAIIRDSDYGTLNGKAVVQYAEELVLEFQDRKSVV